ncbi:AAA family ATPase [Caballeronia sp. AZ10_KS36]|uniref:ATP-dependent nuclease n=1 Tax=Caballeronia sp. AZ10_KS36 TaxID=2921757 RepID=UPI00202850A3|nr:AAA family ATPase [Caballeronia sp. AZ10_KS36]
MKLLSVRVENVRSFADEQVLRLDGDISIIIGPNGSGKTNLLDAIFVSLRRHIFVSWVAPEDSREPGRPMRFRFQRNDQINHTQLHKHTDLANRDQVITFEIQVTQQDVQNMERIAKKRDVLSRFLEYRYNGVSLPSVERWSEGHPPVGRVINFVVRNGNIQALNGAAENVYFDYLSNFDWIAHLLAESDGETLPMPMLLFPAVRSNSGFTPDISLMNFSEAEIKKQVDATHSGSAGAYTHLALGRIAQRYRALLETVGADAMQAILQTPELRMLDSMLTRIGYTWRLQCTNPNQNQYSIVLKKESREFLVNNASSGEKALLTYLFAIYGLNVRDAVVFIDEPELHLHPRWQKILMELFELLSKETGNKFLLATHSPTFVSPETITMVSRVVMQEGCSKIIRLRDTTLPDARLLFSIINSHNNESLFFADKVVLVEGISDRLFFRKLFARFMPKDKRAQAIEVVAVGGKGYFDSYKKVLSACVVPHCLIADRDYIDQVGTEKVKKLFKLDVREVKKDVIDNIKSKDGEALVNAIEAAMASGNWGEAKDTWAYIKSKRVMLKDRLDDNEQALFDQFLAEKRVENIFILKQGALEAYLPDGFLSKDVEKLISFLDFPDFYERLPDVAQRELKALCSAVLE